jgi:ribosomal protein S18 acetylase RimI-like enzyme
VIGGIRVPEDERFYKFYQMQIDLGSINLIEARKEPHLMIRSCKRDELRELAKVFNKVFSDTTDPYPSIGEDDLLSLPTERILIAELDGKIVGFLMCGIRTIENEKVGVIGYIGVLGEYRRKGIATSLAVEAGRYFLENRLKRVIAEVYFLNKGSYRFMQGFGFQESAVIKVPIDETKRPLYKVNTS